MRLIQYFKETQAEVKNITWPSRKDTIIHGVLVIVISLAIGAFLSGLDIGFQEALTSITNR